MVWLLQPNWWITVTQQQKCEMLTTTTMIVTKEDSEKMKAGEDKLGQESIASRADTATMATSFFFSLSNIFAYAF